MNYSPSSSVPPSDVPAGASPHSLTDSNHTHFETFVINFDPSERQARKPCWLLVNVASGSRTHFADLGQLTAELSSLTRQG